VCAALSRENEHANALNHARLAVSCAEEALLTSTPTPASDNSDRVLADMVAVLAIAYNNTGVEEEFLGNLKESLPWCVRRRRRPRPR
jgi:hypothetical protein